MRRTALSLLAVATACAPMRATRTVSTEPLPPVLKRTLSRPSKALEAELRVDGATVVVRLHTRESCGHVWERGRVVRTTTKTSPDAGIVALEAACALVGAGVLVATCTLECGYMSGSEESFHTAAIGLGVAVTCGIATVVDLLSGGEQTLERTEQAEQMHLFPCRVPVQEVVLLVDGNRYSATTDGDAEARFELDTPIDRQVFTVMVDGEPVLSRKLSR
jgi:hypothetical protein